MRYILSILILFVILKISGQDISHTEDYLRVKYRYSDTISGGQLQYIDKSIGLYQDTLLNKYLKDFDFYLVKFRGLICWTPDSFNAIIIYSLADDKYLILEPIDRSSPDSLIISVFENRKIENNDIIPYCELFANMLAEIGNSKPRLSEPIKNSNDIIQIKYYNEITRDKLWRLINFHFIDENILKEIFIINPKTGYNYKDLNKEVEYINNQ